MYLLPVLNILARRNAMRQISQELRDESPTAKGGMYTPYKSQDVEQILLVHASDTFFNANEPVPPFLRGGPA